MLSVWDAACVGDKVSLNGTVSSTSDTNPLATSAISLWIGPRGLGYPHVTEPVSGAAAVLYDKRAPPVSAKFSPTPSSPWFGHDARARLTPAIADSVKLISPLSVRRWANPGPSADSAHPKGHTAQCADAGRIFRLAGEEEGTDVWLPRAGVKAGARLTHEHAPRYKTAIGEQRRKAGRGTAILTSARSTRGTTSTRSSSSTCRQTDRAGAARASKISIPPGLASSTTRAEIRRTPGR